MRALRTLVLNADHRPFIRGPVEIISARDALETVLRDGAYVVEAWPDVFFRSPSVSIPAPKTIALREYVRVNATPKFCRHSVLLRDRYSCQYCGERREPRDLTYDHVVPRSRGGRTVWGNIVMACHACNGQKRNRTCAESGMHPLAPPHAPTNHELAERVLEFMPNEDRQTWADYLYWNAELEP